MSKYPYISQVDQRDCGVAALAMILKHYGSSYSLAYLRELAQTSREGTSALGLVEAAKQLGLETQAIRADLDLFKQESLSYPFIAHVVKGLFCPKQSKINISSITGVTNIGLVDKRAQELQSQVPVSHVHSICILFPLQLTAYMPDTRLNA